MKCGASSNDDLVHKDVVIIGNGPSGIALSYMLAGHQPYVRATTHPDELLATRLQPTLERSLVDVGLATLAAGLEGRTSNPISLLLDALVHPCADVGLEMDSLVEWRRDGPQFHKFGHVCEIVDANERDPMAATRRTNFLLRCFNRLRRIDEANQRSYSFLRSQKKIANEHRKLLEHPHIVHPFSILKLSAEIVCCVVVLLQALMLPLDIAFYAVDVASNPVHSTGFKAVRLATDVVSFLEILTKFVCGYCDMKENRTVLQPSRIARHYLNGSFTLDFISSIPFDVVLNSYATSEQSPSVAKWYFVGHYVGLVKLLRYYLFVLYTSRLFEGTINEMWYIVHRVGIALITFIIYLHVLCCLMIAWNAYQIKFSASIADAHVIVKSYGKELSSVHEMYMRYFYLACLLAFNAHNGLTTYHAATVLFTINAWLCSRLLYILAVAFFIQLLTAMQSSSQKYTEMLWEVEDYMAHRQIPMFLQRRILAYYDIKFQQRYFQEAEILSTVSAQLREEIVMATCRKLVENVPFLRNLPPALVVRIVSSLKYEIYLTNDVITKVGTVGDCMYFISTGTVAVYTAHGREMCHLQDGDHFGEVSLVMKGSHARIASVIAAEVCELYRFDRGDLMRAMRPYPNIYERIVLAAAERFESTQINTEAPIRREREVPVTFASANKHRATRPSFIQKSHFGMHSYVGAMQNYKAT